MEQENRHFILGLNEKKDQFDRTLKQQVQDSKARNRIQSAELVANNAYQNAMIKISQMSEVNRSTALALQLGQQRENFLSNASQVLLAAGVSQEDIASQVTNLMNTFKESADEIAANATKIKETEIEGIPTSTTTGTPQEFTVPPRTSPKNISTDVTANAQKLTDQINKKKRGGLIGIASL